MEILVKLKRKGADGSSVCPAVEVAKSDSDGHERRDAEVRKAAEILIRNALDESTAKALLTGSQPREITQERFDQITKVLSLNRWRSLRSG
jgi:hypothetical protein